MDKKNNARKADDRRGNDRRVKNVAVDVNRRKATNRRTDEERRQKSV